MEQEELRTLNLTDDQQHTLVRIIHENGETIRRQMHIAIGCTAYDDPEAAAQFMTSMTVGMVIVLQWLDAQPVDKAMHLKMVLEE